METVSMRKIMLVLGLAACAAAFVPTDADARSGGARSGAARFTPGMQGGNLRFRFNREIAQRLRLQHPRIIRRGR
jgi:hypothetical protein